MKSPVQTEESMLASVATWLEGRGWVLHHEVELTGDRADLVATRGDETVVIEGKMSLSFEVLAQADRWLRYTSASYIAVPPAGGATATKRARWSGRHMAERCVKLLGLGMLEVQAIWPLDAGRIEPVRVVVKAPVKPSYDQQLRQALRAEHRDHARAGTNRGGFVTSYRLTCEALARYAKEHPGAPLRTALAAVDHHYGSLSSGVNALSKWSRKGATHGLDIRSGDDGPVVFATEEPST